MGVPKSNPIKSTDEILAEMDRIYDKYATKSLSAVQQSELNNIALLYAIVLALRQEQK